MPLLVSADGIFEDGSVDQPGAFTSVVGGVTRYTNVDSKFLIRFQFTNDESFLHTRTGQFRLIASHIDAETTVQSGFFPVTTTSKYVQVFDSPHMTNGEAIPPDKFVFGQSQEACLVSGFGGAVGEPFAGIVCETGLSQSLTWGPYNWTEIIFTAKILAADTTCHDGILFSLEFVGQEPAQQHVFCTPSNVPPPIPFVVEILKHICPEPCICCPMCCQGNLPPSVTAEIDVKIVQIIDGNPFVYPFTHLSLNMPLTHSDNSGYRYQKFCNDTGIRFDFPGVEHPLAIIMQGQLNCCQGRSGRCEDCLLRDLDPDEDPTMDLGTPFENLFLVAEVVPGPGKYSTGKVIPDDLCDFYQIPNASHGGGLDLVGGCGQGTLFKGRCAGDEFAQIATGAGSGVTRISCNPYLALGPSGKGTLEFACGLPSANEGVTASMENLVVVG